MSNRSDIRPIDPRSPDPAAVAAAAGAIHRGGVVVFPTRCIYGLGADASNSNAVKSVYEMKQRRSGKPILILIHEQEALPRWVQSVPGTGQRLMDRFWPGRLTLVFEAKPEVPEILTGGTGKIGIRLCGHPVARALVQAVGGPITGTSANISGEVGCAAVASLPPRIVRSSDLVLDAGPLSGGPGSTIVDVTEYPPKILREGAIPAADIFAAIGHPPRNGVDKRP